VFTYPAAFSLADKARNIDLSTGFGERKKGRPKTNLGILPEKLPGEII
jgi:hypothetical protein